MLNPILINNKIKNAKHVAEIKQVAERHPIVASGITTGLLVTSMMFGLGNLGSVNNAPTIDQAFADDQVQETHTLKVKDVRLDTKSIFPDYSEYGVASIFEYKKLLDDSKVEAEGCADALIEELGSYLTDEQKETVLANQTRMTTAVTMKQYKEAKEEFTSIADEAEAKYEASLRSRASHASGGSGYVSNGSGLTRSGGVNWFNGRKETWYSQRVLPGGGLRIPGRHVASDGTIRDADGYICVAASDLAYGSTVETSLGTGKVYDTGCAAGVTDVYVDW